MKSRRTSWYGSTCSREVTNWFSQTPCVTLVPASFSAASIVAKIDLASRMPLASPASGSAGLPRTSGASPPPTGPPIVPETNTHGPAFTAFGMRSGGGGGGRHPKVLFGHVVPLGKPHPRGGAPRKSGGRGRGGKRKPRPAPGAGRPTKGGGTKTRVSV